MLQDVLLVVELTFLRLKPVMMEIQQTTKDVEMIVLGF